MSQQYERMPSGRRVRISAKQRRSREKAERAHGRTILVFTAPESSALSTSDFENGEKLLSLEQLVAQDILQDAVDNQLSLMASGRFDVFKGKSGGAFFATFMQDPLFTEVYQMAQAEALRFTDDWDFTQRFRGAMFERMAYIYLSIGAGGKLGEGLVPISSSDTVDIMAVLYPDKEIIDHGFGQFGLAGKYVPDLLVARAKEGKPKIVKVVESSLSPRKKRDFVQSGIGFDNLAEGLGGLAEELKFVRVSPIFGKPVLESIVVPVNVNSFVEVFEPNLYFKHRQSGGPTLAELRKQWHASLAGRQAAFGEPGIFQIRRSMARSDKA